MLRFRLCSAAFRSSRTSSTAIGTRVCRHARFRQTRVVPIVAKCARRAIRSIRPVGPRGMRANRAAYGPKIWTNAVLWAYVALAAFGTGSEMAHGARFA